jgi:hypothetical protein
MNVDALLRPDTKSRYEAHKVALDAGFLTIDEVRELENREPFGETESPLPVPAEIVSTPEQEKDTEEAGSFGGSDFASNRVAGSINRQGDGAAGGNNGQSQCSESKFDFFEHGYIV